ncbi:hypothetical protein B0H16DRAFT_1701040, partial [Mycena metata]
MQNWATSAREPEAVVPITGPTRPGIASSGGVASSSSSSSCGIGGGMGIPMGSRWKWNGARGEEGDEGVWGDEQVDTLRRESERVLANESRFPLRESLEERREREELVPLRLFLDLAGFSDFPSHRISRTRSPLFAPHLTRSECPKAYGLNSRNGGKPSQAGSLQSSIDLMRLCPAQFAAVSCKSKYTVHLLDFLLATEDVLLELEIENVSARGDYIRVGGLGFCYPGEEVCSFSTNFRPFGMNQ